MQNFIFHNPTRYIFGEGQIQLLSQEISKIGKKVFLVYGSGSIKKNGVYEQVLAQLTGFEVKEFSGVEPNPRLETLAKALPLIREFAPDIILAVGGGSVIDGAKFLAVAAYFDGDDLWEIVKTHGEAVTGKVIPLGVVLTMSATASEFNGGSVITRWATHEKDYFETEETRPRFSFVDPQAQYSLPEEQIIYGIIDPFSHVLEQYITQTTDFEVQDRLAEALLLSLIDQGPKVLRNKQDYSARANLAFAASLALNNLIGSGVTQDWATHSLEHVVSGFYDIPHAAGLAIITPHWMQVVGLTQKFEKMVRYGRNVWGLTGTDEVVAAGAITKTSEFFSSLGAKMTLTAWNIPHESLEQLVSAAVKYGNIGENALSEVQIRDIYTRCY